MGGRRVQKKRKSDKKERINMGARELVKDTVMKEEVKVRSWEAFAKLPSFPAERLKLLKNFPSLTHAYACSHILGSMSDRIAA